MKDSDGHTATIPGRGGSSFEYRIVAMPQVPFSPASCRLWGDEHDMERGVLYIPPAQISLYQEYVKRSYVPVQAIPQDMAKPDVIAEIYSGDEHVTTLHFCAAWHRVQQNDQRWRWERLSFSQMAGVMQYYQAIPRIKNYLSICPSCFRLHQPYAICPLTEPMSLAEALSITGLALRVYRGTVYFVSWNPYAPLHGSLWHGNISWYAITRLGGLQACDAPLYPFVEMEEGKHFLAAQNVPLEEGWIAVDERPDIFLP